MNRDEQLELKTGLDGIEAIHAELKELDERVTGYADMRKNFVLLAFMLVGVVALLAGVIGHRYFDLLVYGGLGVTELALVLAMLCELAQTRMISKKHLLNDTLEKAIENQIASVYLGRKNKYEVEVQRYEANRAAMAC